MERKNYLVEELSNEEKVYFKRIVMTARNKYLERNYRYFNNENVIFNDEFITNEESVVDTVILKCQNEIKSAVEFEKVFSNPKIYNVVKALSLKEKEVLFYLYKEHKNIKEVTEIMNLDRKTVRKYRDKAHKQIIENLIKGDF